MKKMLLAISMLVFALSQAPHAANKPDPVFVSGWVVEIDPSKHVFTLRNGKKLLQFSTIVSRTSVTIDGRGSLQTSLGSARVGDAAMCKVSLAEEAPFLEAVEFTHRPSAASRVASRPGFVINPYSNAVYDARKCAPGEMVEDFWTGKVFLIP